MPATATVQARLEPELKDEAGRILVTMGITPSHAIRLLFQRIVAEQGFPQDLLVPNATTIAAMQEESLASFDSVDDLMADLRRDD